MQIHRRDRFLKATRECDSFNDLTAMFLAGEVQFLHRLSTPRVFYVSAALLRHPSPDVCAREPINHTTPGSNESNELDEHEHEQVETDVGH